MRPRNSARTCPRRARDRDGLDHRGELLALEHGVGGRLADVGGGSRRDRRVRGGERGASLSPSPIIRTLWPCAFRALEPRDLAVRASARHATSSMPSSLRRVAATASRSPDKSATACPGASASATTSPHRSADDPRSGSGPASASPAIPKRRGPRRLLAQPTPGGNRAALYLRRDRAEPLARRLLDAAAAGTVGNRCSARRRARARTDGGCCAPARPPPQARIRVDRVRIEQQGCPA